MSGAYIVIGVLVIVIALLAYLAIAPRLKKYKVSIKKIEPKKPLRKKTATKKKEKIRLDTGFVKIRLWMPILSQCNSLVQHLDFWRLSKMNVSPSKAKKCATSLLREIRRGRSWRQIAREDYQGKINHTTLRKFAVSKGTYIPKDESVHVLLGIQKERNPYAILPKWYQRTPEALQFFQGQRDKIKTMSRETRNEVMSTRRK